jgi:lipopolysaccharide transport system permease protein
MLVFGTVLGTRLSVTADIPGDYTSYILVGLVPWFFTAYLLGRGPSVFTSNSNLVKQVVFPIEILPAAAVIVGCIIYAPTFLCSSSISSRSAVACRCQLSSHP